MEIGHVPVSPGGPPCRCGSQGCLNICFHLRAQTQAAGIPEGGTTEAAARAEPNRRLRAADERARAALDTAGHALGAGLLAVASVTDAGEATWAAISSTGLRGRCRASTPVSPAGAPPSSMRGSPSPPVSSAPMPHSGASSTQAENTPWRRPPSSRCRRPGGRFMTCRTPGKRLRYC
ncbi:ROK family protein [Streptomyces sp. NPDC005897]|uniref:ROK family protein n=1 Tax=Streptomyces sp. NPDC005897 TaxID=3157081 RepID=UPI0033CAFA5F